MESHSLLLEQHHNKLQREDNPFNLRKFVKFSLDVHTEYRTSSAATNSNSMFSLDKSGLLRSKCKYFKTIGNPSKLLNAGRTLALFFLNRIEHTLNRRICLGLSTLCMSFNASFNTSSGQSMFHSGDSMMFLT